MEENKIYGLIIVISLIIGSLSSLNAYNFDDPQSDKDAAISSVGSLLVTGIAGFGLGYALTSPAKKLLGTTGPDFKAWKGIQEQKVRFDEPNTEFVMELEHLSGELGGQVVAFREGFLSNIKYLEQELYNTKGRDVRFGEVYHSYEVRDEFDLYHGINTIEHRILNDLSKPKTDVEKLSLAKELYIKLQRLNVRQSILDKIFELRDNVRIG